MCDVLKVPVTECSCINCQNMCRIHPCTTTPNDVERLIEAGYIERLSLDYFDLEEPEPYLPCMNRWRTVKAVLPGVKGREFVERNPSQGECTFLTANGLCELHDIKLKPTMGRIAHCGLAMGDFQEQHTLVVLQWDTVEGLKVYQEFLEEILACWKSSG